MLHCNSDPVKKASALLQAGRSKDRSMSQQLAFSSIASVLAMACLCLAAGSLQPSEDDYRDVFAAQTVKADLDG